MVGVNKFFGFMKLHIHGQADLFNGWGLHTHEAVKYLRNRTELTFSSHHRDDMAGVGCWPLGGVADTVLQITPPDCQPHSHGAVWWTMWESTLLPAQAVENLNTASLVLVPNLWNARCFKASGVTALIHIARLGYDDHVFQWTPRRLLPLTFGAGGSISGAGERKEVQRVVDAFHATGLDAKLEVKTMPWDGVNTHGDSRIKVIQEVWSDPHWMQRWYGGLHCFVTATRCEGVGLMPLQAMVNGADVIAPIHSGHGSYMTDTTVWPLPHKAQPAGGGYGGMQYGVDTQSITDAMVGVAERHHREWLLESADLRSKHCSRSVGHLTWRGAMDEVWDLLKEGANLASMETACESTGRPCHDGHTGESQAD